MRELYCKCTVDDDEITFYSDGTLDASAYSYEIDSHGYLELSVAETRELYEAMKKYYGD